MGKFTVMAMAMITLASCKSMKGNLSVSDDASFKRKTIFGNEKTIKVPAGSYSAKLKIAGKDSLKLKLKNDDKSFKTIKFSAEEEIKIPAYEGEVIIKVDQMGTNYDLDVKVATDTSSSTYNTTESCISGYRSEEVCRYIPRRTVCKGNKDVVRDRRDVNWDARRDRQNDRDNDDDRTVCYEEGGYTSCSIESVPIYGSQSVTYALETTTKNVRAALKLEGKKIIAKFAHSDTDTDKTRLSSGVCY